jgi:hypothetical protein
MSAPQRFESVFSKWDFQDKSEAISGAKYFSGGSLAYWVSSRGLYDWFVLSHALDIGTVTDVKGIAITNVFGERLWIEPVREAAGSDLARWSMFALSGMAAARSPPPKPLVLLPAAAKVQQGAPVEEVAFSRDAGWTLCHTSIPPDRSLENAG